MTVEGIDPEDDILIGEENGEHIYISRKALKESIHNSQVLSALLYESERCLNEEEQTKMREIINTQRELLKKKEEMIKNQSIKKDQIKTITTELLK